MSIRERARAKPQVCDHCPAKTDRSLPQHRRLFGLIRAAYMHWPEDHDFYPSNEDHLRKYLTAKAGHYTVQTVEFGHMPHGTIKSIAEAAIAAAGAYAFVKAISGKLIIYTPSSIAFDKLSHKAACKLFDEIGSVIETEIGIKADELLKNHEAAA
jgi:hypothetical protein